MSTDLLYVLHSGNLYGTEQMALATLKGLGCHFTPFLYAPRGPVHEAAKRLGIPSQVFNSPLSLGGLMAPHFRRSQCPAVIATGIVHSLQADMLRRLYGRKIPHLHIVHGGTDERFSYGRKVLLDRLPVRLVAVSGFVAERLQAHGCDAHQITVIENFLPNRPQRMRARFDSEGIRRIAVVSRADPIKRIGMLITALERMPDLTTLKIDVFGGGSELESLRERARPLPGLHLHGFVPTPAERLADYDLLVHTCAEEPFGIALLEAMGAGVPILAPNCGGAGTLIENGVSGYHFAANDPVSLGQALCQLRRAPARELNARVDAAFRQLAERFSPRRGLAQYQALLENAA